MIIINWILDLLLFVSGVIVGVVVEPNRIEFGVLQMAVAIILIALFVMAATYSGYAWRAMRRAPQATGTVE